MPQTTKSRTKPKTAVNATVPERLPERMNSEVLTLAEAAAYLRLPETDVLRLTHTEKLPGRQVGRDWRFLKAALQEAMRVRIGSWKDDPDLDDMLRETFMKRGRSRV